MVLGSLFSSSCTICTVPVPHRVYDFSPSSTPTFSCLNKQGITYLIGGCKDFVQEQAKHLAQGLAHSKSPSNVCLFSFSHMSN